MTYSKRLSAIERSRSFLEINKIFFETIAAVLLSVMSICVSWQTNRIYDQQAKIMEAQAKIALFEQEPILNCSYSLIQNPNTGLYERDEAFVQNMGKGLRDFDDDWMVVVEVRLAKKGTDAVTRAVIVPLVGYYDTSYGSQAPVGQLVRSIGSATEGNYRRFVKAVWDFEEKPRKKGLFADCNLKRYIHVWYKNLLGESRDEVYLVGPGGGSRLGETEAKAILNLNDQRRHKSQFIDFANFNAESLLKVRETISESEK